MLKSPMTHGVLTDVKYEKDVDRYAKDGGVQNSLLASVYYINKNKPGSMNTTYKFANTVMKKTKKTVTVSKQNLWGGSIGVETGAKFGIPGVAEGEWKLKFDFKYERTEVKTEAKDDGEDMGLNYDMGGGATNNMIEPGKAVHCEAKSMMGDFSSNYVATMQASLKDGSQIDYKVKGHVESTTWMDATVSCEEVAVKDIPKNANIGKPENVQKRRALLFKA